MSNLSIEKIYKNISKLKRSDKMTLISKLIAEISNPYDKKNATNIYDIKGVGKEIWDNTDAQEYVNKERASWK